jgi:hypothetical protein
MTDVTISLRNLTQSVSLSVAEGNALAYTLFTSSQQPDDFFQLRVRVCNEAECSDHMEEWRVKAGRIIFHTILPIQTNGLIHKFTPQFPSKL